jgi:TolB-like protein
MAFWKRNMVYGVIVLLTVAASAGICDTLSTEIDTLPAEDYTQSPESGPVLPNIAVLTLKNSEGISQGDASLITDRLNVELFNTKRVNLLEREQIKDILKEQGFQGSGACSDEACLVEMGQILGVQEIITGSLGRLGTLIIINLRSINVGSGRITKVVSQDIPGKLEDVIYYLPNIARKLVGLDTIPITGVETKETQQAEEKKAKAKELKPSKNTGMVVVKTIPDGASVFLNGIKVGTTPFTDNTLIPEHYSLKISHPRYEDYTESFDLTAGSTKTIAQNLVYKYGLVTITSEPAGAAVSLNQKKAGVTPFQNDTVKPGEYSLNLSLAGYVPVIEKITVQKHTRDTFSYTLFSEEKLDSVKAHKREMKKGKRNARRAIFGLLAAGAWGTGIYYNAQVKQHNDKAQEYCQEYKNFDPTVTGVPIDPQTFNDTYQNAVDEKKLAEDNALVRNILYGTGGLFIFFFVLSIPF